MFSSTAATLARSFSTSSASRIKVAVLGASGGIGKPLSMLLKLNPRVSRLALYTARTRGVAEDIGHIETLAPVSAHVGPHHLEEALQVGNIEIGA